MSVEAHTHRHTQTHNKAMRVWQMKEVNCLSLTSWVAAGGYECTVLWREGKWICWLSLFVSEAIPHLSFAPYLHSPVTFLSSATPWHFSLFTTWSLFCLLFPSSPDVFLSSFVDSCPCVKYFVYETFRERTFLQNGCFFVVVCLFAFSKGIKVRRVLAVGSIINVVTRGFWHL